MRLRGEFGSDSIVKEPILAHVNAKIPKNLGHSSSDAEKLHQVLELSNRQIKRSLDKLRNIAKFLESDKASRRGEPIMPKTKKPTSDAVEILRRRYYEGKPGRLAQLDEARAEDELARKIHELREQAGLTQERLAKLVGTTASVISRLEDSDYEGHSLTMLKRIAAAVNKRVEIRFVSRAKKLQTG